MRVQVRRLHQSRVNRLATITVAKLATDDVGRGVATMARMAAEAAIEDGDIDLRSLGFALWQRKAWILWPTVLVAIVAAIGVIMIAPRYKSEARILYDGRENVFLRPEAEKSANAERAAADPETLTSQVQIVLSRQLALEVIGELKLNDL